MAILSINFAFPQANLFISEVADPADNFEGRFIELYNAGVDAVDFSTVVMYLSRQSNGGTTWGDVQLTGTIAAGATYVIGGTSFATLYGFAPDLETGILSGNGDDGYFLYAGGNHTTGTLHDAYGVVDQDGTGEPWEYLDSRASRAFGVDAPNTTWTAAEWEIMPGANIADFDPGIHAPVSDVEPPVWESGYPKAVNILETSFDIAAQLDESSTVYYVVMETGATTPSVAEVQAGTGESGATPVTSGNFLSGTSETTEAVTGLTTDLSYTVFLVAEDDEPVPNVQASVVSFDATPVIPPDTLYIESFDSDLGDFTVVNVTGNDVVWYWEAFSGNGYAEGNAYPNNEQSEDWLISGGFNLDAATDEVISFKSVSNFDNVSTILTVYLSNNFTGEYTPEAVAAATWEDITSNFTLSPGGSYTWYESGGYDISTGTGMGYIAFVYTYPGGGSSGLWEIDDVLVTGFLIPGSDATLSDLQVDGVTLANFDGATTSYTVELPAGTTTVPTVTFTTSDVNASGAVTNATDLAGDEAARTTTVLVTAQDGVTTETYSVLFNPVLEAATVAELRAADRSRVHLLTAEVLLTYKNDATRNQKYIQDATGGVMIDDAGGVITTNYEIGDKITGIKGTLTTYGALLEFVPVEDPGAAVSTGNAVEPELITLEALNTGLDTLESTFVKVMGITFADAGADFASKTNYNISDGAITSVLRTNYSDLDYIGTPIPAMADLSGVVIQFNGTAQIVPRSAADIYVYSSDASLSDLMVNGTTVDGFVSETTSYAVELPFGTVDIPVVTFTTTDANASGVVTDATDLQGDEAARTTTVDVTAEDGTTMAYTIVFTVGLNTDATLSDLAVDGTTVANFDPGTSDYAVTLPVGTTQVPAVTYTLNDPNASAVQTDATDLTGDEAARTTTVDVTAQNGVATMSYKIVFTVDNTGIPNTAAVKLSVYPVPVGSEMIVTGLDNVKSFEIINLLGSIVRKVEVTGDEMRINVSDLDSGIYMIRTTESTLRFIKK